MFYNKTGRTSIKAAVRSMAEKKIMDSYQVFGPGAMAGQITVTGQIISLTDVSQGMTDATRIGDKCTGTSLRIRVYSEVPGQNSASSPKIYPDPYMNLRIIVFIWKDDTEPTADQIVDGTTLVNNDIKSLLPLNHDMKIKRKLLMDQNYTASGLVTIAGNISSINTSYKLPVLIKKDVNLTKLKGGLNTINFQNGTLLGINKIYMLAIANHTVDETNDFSWRHIMHFRYTFYDM